MTEALDPSTTKFDERLKLIPYISDAPYYAFRDLANSDRLQWRDTRELMEKCVDVGIIIFGNSKLSYRDSLQRIALEDIVELIQAYGGTISINQLIEDSVYPYREPERSNQVLLNASITLETDEKLRSLGSSRFKNLSYRLGAVIPNSIKYPNKTLSLGHCLQAGNLIYGNAQGLDQSEPLDTVLAVMRGYGADIDAERLIKDNFILTPQTT